MAVASAPSVAGFDRCSPHRHSTLVSANVGPRLVAFLAVATGWLAGTGAEANSASELAKTLATWSAAPSPLVLRVSGNGPLETNVKAKWPAWGSHGGGAPALAKSDATGLWPGSDPDAPDAVRFFSPTAVLDAPAVGAAVALIPTRPPASRTSGPRSQNPPSGRTDAGTAPSGSPRRNWKFLTLA